MLVLVVLGNRLNDDGSISEIMRERLLLALAIDNAVNPQKIVLSGGVANPKAHSSEAEQMSLFLEEIGVDPSKMILEDSSLSTAQNAKFSVPIVASLGADKLLLCTSPEHMHRSFLNPKKLFAARLRKYPSVKLFTCCSESELIRLSDDIKD